MKTFIFTIALLLTIPFIGQTQTVYELDRDQIFLENMDGKNAHIYFVLEKERDDWSGLITYSGQMYYVTEDNKIYRHRTSYSYSINDDGSIQDYLVSPSKRKVDIRVVDNVITDRSTDKKYIPSDMDSVIDIYNRHSIIKGGDNDHTDKYMAIFKYYL